MIGSLFKKPNKKIILSIDFSGETVKAVLFRKEKEKSHVLGYSVQFLEEFGIFDVIGFEENNAKKIISSLLEEIKKQNNKKIEEVYIRLPADILRGEIISEICRRENSKRKITKSEQDEIRQLASIGAKRKISMNYAQKTGIMPRDIYFPTLKIFKTKIDGYETPSLEGFCGETIEFKVLVTFLPKSYFESIKKIFYQFRLNNIKLFHAAELISGAVSSFMDDCIFLDIGGDITKVILFKGGKIEGIDEMAGGGRIITKLISHLLGIPEKEAKQLKERYSNKDLDENMRARMREIVNLNLHSWFHNLKLKLSGFRTLLPSDIFIFGDGSRLLGTEEILTEGDWTASQTIGPDSFLESSLCLISDPKVKFVNPGEIRNIVKIPGELNNPQFTTVFLQSI